MSSEELYACVYAREFPAQALLRLRPELCGQPCVVLQGEAPAQSVCALNTRARLLGLRRGMTKVEVDTFEAVHLLPRSQSVEASVRQVLLECAGSFSPRVEDRSEDGVFLCAIDSSGTGSLFGPPLDLARLIRRRVRALGVVASVTLSANLNTAVCAARGRREGSPIQVIARGRERGALAALPLSVLGISSEQAETFQAWGIPTVGALAELPRTALIARLGQQGDRLLQLARGECPHLFQPVEVPFVLEETTQLDAPLDNLESLQFLLSAMLDQLIVRAASRVYALASITTTLQLEGGGSHERTVNPRVPTNNKQLWLKLLHLDLENHPPQAAIIAVHLHAEPGATSKVQLGLFSPQLPEPGRLDVTLARITAVVGDNNVGRAVLDDTHRADDFHMETFSISSIKPTGSTPGPRLCLRALRPPEPARVTLRRGRPYELFYRGQNYFAEEVYGPWLSGGDWWNEAVWGSEQWDVIANSGNERRIACRLARDFVQNEWHVAGLYD